MKTCCVIVTYGDRWSLLSQVLKGLQSQPIDQLIVVNNGASERSRKEIASALPLTGIPSERIDLSANKGSAAGFKAGITAALRTSCDFVWLLDDDNLPDNGALMSLLKLWDKINCPNKDECLALLSYRVDRPDFKSTLTGRDPWLILPRRNSFLGFHIKDLVEKLRERFSHGVVPTPIHAESFAVKAAPYGGFFFHRSLMRISEVPDDRLVVYLDDFDFTLKMTGRGVDIRLVPGSTIRDLQSSDYLTTRKHLLYHSIFDCKTPSTVYYVNRNLFRLQTKYLVDNWILYRINMLSFYVIIAIMGLLRWRWDRLGLLFRAVRDAKTDRAGPDLS